MVTVDIDNNRVLEADLCRTRDSFGSEWSKRNVAVQRDMEAVGIDMWQPFVETIGVASLTAKMVHGMFHVIKYLKVRRQNNRQFLEAWKKILERLACSSCAH